MDPVTAKFGTPISHSAASESEFEPERELAMSIPRHFKELVDVLIRTAELLGETADGYRLRAAALAAKRGKISPSVVCQDRRPRRRTGRLAAQG